MNDYRITFQNTETDSRETVTITARNESEAQRTFRKDHKGDSTYGDIWSVELHRENTLATKAQERETLEKIKAMVEELGPQSYLATAFEGCFQDAEDNITDDAAYSMKSRYESTQAAHERTAKEVVELKTKLDLALKTIDRLRQENEELEVKQETELAALRRQIPNQNDLNAAIVALRSQTQQVQETRDDKAQTIIEYADRPETRAFTDAVQEHRALVKAADAMQAVVDRLCAVSDAQGNRAGA